MQILTKSEQKYARGDIANFPFSKHDMIFCSLRIRNFLQFLFNIISGISFFVCYDPPYCHINEYNVGVCWILRLIACLKYGFIHYVS